MTLMCPRGHLWIQSDALQRDGGKCGCGCTLIEWPETH